MRGTFTSPLPVSPGSAPQQVRSLDELLRNGTVAVFPSDTAAAVQSKAREFIRKNADALELEKDASVFTLENASETLSGRHITLAQRINGVRVIDGGIQLRVGPIGDLLSVTRNVVSVPAGKTASVPTTTVITPSQAEEIAWNDIRVTGELLEPVTSEKAYLNEDARLRLVYVVRTAVSRPLGYWEHRIDAKTGEIISRHDRKTQDRKNAAAAPPAPQLSYPLMPRELAMRQLEARAKQLAGAVANKNAATGTAPAVVFSPNPVITLDNDKLKATDPPEVFAGAYITVNLEGLTKNGGRFHLSNDLVRLEDFEPGLDGRRHPPSTAETAWTATRENIAFHDAMTYHYVYTNLLYLRSLGYRGGKELFPDGIAIDTDGANGDDQSYFVPDSNRLVFGHGCVADNEDTDVILHELGHAIHFHLNPGWGGGDSGAIGEGFGDYWAVSHRARMKNGLKFPGRLFLWDGIASCWEGRRADRVSARYDPNRRYKAHQVVDGIVADEFWSTPLVSALLELRGLGESFESVDTVVLEGMAAAGKNFTMRTLALKTVEVAHQLYPERAHAGVFLKHFKALGIVP
jgi:hypothetical protein